MLIDNSCGVLQRQWNCQALQRQLLDLRKCDKLHFLHIFELEQLPVRELLSFKSSLSQQGVCGLHVSLPDLLEHSN
jgi:hypothetical protein